jgi:hypothetical protein
MDRNYTGGLLQIEKSAKMISRREISEIVPFSNLMPELLIAFDASLKRDTPTYRNIVDDATPVIDGFDKVHVCRMCKNYFTVNRSYGKHDCFAHYGYRDYTVPGEPRWSCCGNPLSSIGCMECDHLAEATRTTYSNPSPTMEISLSAGLYGSTLPNSRSFFFKRYLEDKDLRAHARKNPDFLRVKLRYLDEKKYRSLLSSSALSKTRSRYVPYNVNTYGKDGKIKKRERVHINLKTSKLIVPLSRSSAV